MIRQPTIQPIPKIQIQKIQIPQIRIPAFRFHIENGKLVCTVYKGGGFTGQLFKGVDEEMAIYTKRTTEAPKIKVIRRWDMEDIMNMCIKHNFYTRGDTRAYTKMLNYVKQKEPTPEEIYIVAVDILDHTDENEDQSITNIIERVHSSAMGSPTEQVCAWIWLRWMMARLSSGIKRFQLSPRPVVRP